MQLSRRLIKRLTNKGYDLLFMSRTQPKGHVDFQFDDRFWIQGDGYHCYAFVVSYPTTGLNYNWGAQIMEIEDMRSFMTLTSLDNKEIQKKASKGAEEKLSRISDNRKMSDNQAEQEETEALLALDRDIRTRNVGVKGAWVRIHVSANTEQELMQKVQDLKDSVTDFGLTVFLGEQEMEYHAPLVPGSKQKLLPNAREEQVIPNRDLAGGYWFNHTKLTDRHGTYYGYTSTNGAVNYNFLEVDESRTRPFMMIAGNPRMGQKKFLLKHTDTMFAKGMKIINIDIDGSLLELTKMQYGKIIDVSSSENRINPMQIFPTATADNGIDVDEDESFNKQSSKLKTFAQILNEDITGDDLIRLEKIIGEFYDGENIYSANASKTGRTNNGSKLEPGEHPLISDFATFLALRYRRSRQETELDQASYLRIANTFDSLVSQYGDKFDTYTEFEDLSKEQVVTIDFSKIADNKQLLNLQLTQYLTLVSSYVINNGKLQRQRRGENLDRDQYTHYIINISGADKMFDPQNAQAVVFLADIIESMGTNFGGVVMELSSIQSLLLAGDTESIDPYVVAVRRILALTQHRVFANLPENTIELFAATLSDSMTESELETLSTLTYGQLFLNISGSGNVIFTQQFFGEEEERYNYID